MSCFWKDLHGTNQTCFEQAGFLHELGSYVYMGYESPDPSNSLIEVKKDLSGYTKIGLISDYGLAGDPLLTDPQFFSKNRRVFRFTADDLSTPLAYIERHDGSGAMSDVTPSGLRNSNYRMSMTLEQDALLIMNITNAPFGILQSSSDGGAWTNITGETAVLDGAEYAEIATAVQYNGLLVAFTMTKKIAYSDDNGASWNVLFAVGGGAVNSEFIISQGRLLFTTYDAGSYWTDDGVNWIVSNTFKSRYSAPYFAANGAGTILKKAHNPFNGLYGFSYSTDNGSTWNLMGFHHDPAFSPAGNLGADVDYVFLFWDGSQFVAFLRMFAFGGGDRWDAYTSPTGLVNSWARLPLTMPVFWNESGFARVID